MATNKKDHFPKKVSHMESGYLNWCIIRDKETLDAQLELLNNAEGISDIQVEDVTEEDIQEF